MQFARGVLCATLADRAPLRGIGGTSRWRRTRSSSGPMKTSARRKSTMVRTCRRTDMSGIQRHHETEPRAMWLRRVHAEKQKQALLQAKKKAAAPAATPAAKDKPATDDAQDAGPWVWRLASDVWQHWTLIRSV